jgi:hypothetical protein
MPSRKVRYAISRGDKRGTLVALRYRLATEIDSDTIKPRELATLSRRLLEIDKEITDMDAQHSNDSVGEAVSTPDEALDA